MGAGVSMHQEVYKFRLAASPHIAAREEGADISLERIAASLPVTGSHLLIEGAGGILVPLNGSEFVADLISKLHARVILVSRNYLGSINHSLLTAAYCRQRNLDVAGWIFTDEPGGYEEEISRWTGYPVIAKIPRLTEINRNTLWHQSLLMKENVIRILGKVDS
jgi:dethiobiotin synthetase